MHHFRRAALLVALPAIASCRERTAGSPPDRAPPLAAGMRVAASSDCPLRKTDVRLGVDTIGGVPTRRTIGELRSLCPATRLDTVGVGGTTAAALRFDSPGVTLWAIQSAHDAYGDSLHGGEPADLWAAAGDSLRFPDGALVPRRIGALRALDSVAVVVVDHGDDGTGSYVVRCRYPRFAVVIDNIWPPFAAAGVVPFARASASDTAQVWRVEVEPGRANAAVAEVCKRAPAT